MTCPDWTTLTAHRLVRDGIEPPEWQAALAHAGGCPACRRAAVAADPTLLFQRLAEPELAASADSPAALQTIAAMQQAVATLRRAAAAPSQSAGRRRRFGWRVAAAAALPLCALVLHGVERPGPENLVATRELVPIADVARTASAAPSAELVALPLVDELSSPAARVYELGGTDLSVVMIVDETLDV